MKKLLLIVAILAFSCKKEEIHTLKFFIQTKGKIETCYSLNNDLKCSSSTAGFIANDTVTVYKKIKKGDRMYIVIQSEGISFNQSTGKANRVPITVDYYIDNKLEKSQTAEEEILINDEF